MSTFHFMGDPATLCAFDMFLIICHLFFVFCDWLLKSDSCASNGCLKLYKEVSFIWNILQIPEFPGELSSYILGEYSAW